VTSVLSVGDHSHKVAAAMLIADYQIIPSKVETHPLGSVNRKDIDENNAIGLPVLRQ